MKKKRLRDSLNDNKSTIGTALLFLVPIVLLCAQKETFEVFLFWGITLAICLLTEGLFLLFTNNYAVSVLSFGTLLELIYAINEIVFQCRGNYLSFSDFLCAGVALSVAGRYTIRFSPVLITCLVSECILILICVPLIIFKTGKFSERQGGRIRGLLIVIVTGLTLIFFDVSAYTGYYYYFDEISRKYGLVGKLYVEMKQNGVEKPQNYDRAEIEKYLSGNETKDAQQILPNIIVIMDEALCDYSFIGNLDTNTDPLPYLHELAQEQHTDAKTTYGKLVTPTTGGLTVNTEWEFLTGLSIRMCPSSIPFLQFATPKYEYNLVRNLQQYGYETYAFHPYYVAGYNRRQVYKNLGFDHMTFIEDIDPSYENMGFDERPSSELMASSEDGMYIRNLVSDKYDFEYLINLYEENKTNEPMFIFNVTMQNHGPYSLEGYDGEVRLNAEISGQKDTEQYLSLIHDSDAAIRELINYFTDCETPTVILLFGDHQPNVDEGIYKYLLNSDQITKEDEFKKYYTPFLFWSNYDADIPDIEEISSNFLAAELLDAAGIPKNAWFIKNSEIHNEFSVYSPMLLRDSTGKQIDDLSATGYNIQEEYSKFEYYLLNE